VGAVTNPQSRHPVATAAAYASVAELAPGRLVAGFGAGGTRVFGPMGLRPPRPYTSLLECIDVCEALWRGETVYHIGEFAVDGASLAWSPKRRLPLAIAGRGPRVERLAAERADYVLLAGRAADSVGPLVKRLRSMRQHGRPPAIVWNPVAAWTQAMREDLRAHLTYMSVDMPAAERAMLGSADAVLEKYAIVGSREEVAARLATCFEEIRPELVVFDAGDYSVGYLESLASMAMDAGAAVFHNLETIHGLDTND
jgi:5,10-methylenetetrahydromethanopterin reductase